MALGGIILYIQQGLNVGSVSNVVTSGSDYTLEFRVRFPGSDNDVMQPTELSGALMTLSNGTLGSSYASVWYEKNSVNSITGNIYVTSSAGRLTLPQLPIFDDRFYSISLIKEHRTGSVRLYAVRYDDDRLEFLTSSVALLGQVGAPIDNNYTTIEVGSATALPSRGQFWAHEVRLWSDGLSLDEIKAHAAHFESYGRDRSHDNDRLLLHWRLANETQTDSGGKFYGADSAFNAVIPTGSGFSANANPSTKFLERYAYIPGIDYGWNQEKVRVYDGSTIDPEQAYQDEKFVSLEFNMYDALNEDISHLISSYDELNGFVGLPVNRYRADYEGLQQMRETYFKRLQGRLNFRLFVDMLDFFDTTFVSTIEQLIPARSVFMGDELVVESHMLERPKYQYQLRPVIEGRIDISGSIAMVDRGDDVF